MVLNRLGVGNAHYRSFAGMDVGMAGANELQRSLT